MLLTIRPKKKDYVVVRSPPHYCILNSIELIWSSLEGAIRRKINCGPGKCLSGKEIYDHSICRGLMVSLLQSKPYTMIITIPIKLVL